jgi:ATP-dependent DNA helicase HFM1/MER3
MPHSNRRALQGRLKSLKRSPVLIMSIDDLHDHPIRLSSSSSPNMPITSPTVSALQNRQRTRVPLPPENTTTNLTPASAPCEGFESAPNVAPVVNKIVKHRVSRAKPPSKTPPVVQGIQLVPVTALPDQLRSVFSFDIFNAVQSGCFASAFESDDNLVVSAPTGSGKTVIMELAICRLVAECKAQDFKVVYQAPTKSLCAERYNDWQKKFSILNLECAELTGDTDFGQLQKVQKASIIITTPEKWDSVTRKWKDHAKLMQLVKLFLVDEVHILRDERGATLEAVVSRMKSVVSKIRFVALSATVPNSEDIANWLGKNSITQHLPAHRKVFGESFRPVQLKKYVYGFEANGNDFAFESMLTQRQVKTFIAY